MNRSQLAAIALKRAGLYDYSQLTKTRILKLKKQKKSSSGGRVKVVRTAFGWRSQPNIRLIIERDVRRQAAGEQIIPMIEKKEGRSKKSGLKALKKLVEKKEEPVVLEATSQLTPEEMARRAIEGFRTADGRFIPPSTSAIAYQNKKSWVKKRREDRGVLYGKKKKNFENWLMNLSAEKHVQALTEEEK